MVETAAVSTNNQAIWDVAISKALETLPHSSGLGTFRDLAYFVEDNDRVAEAVRDFELSLIDALVPILRHEVESGRLELADGDDYLKLSAHVVSLLVEQWFVIDLRRELR